MYLQLGLCKLIILLFLPLTVLTAPQRWQRFVPTDLDGKEGEEHVKMFEVSEEKTVSNEDQEEWFPVIEIGNDYYDGEESKEKSDLPLDSDKGTDNQNDDSSNNGIESGQESQPSVCNAVGAKTRGSINSDEDLIKAIRDILMKWDQLNQEISSRIAGKGGISAEQAALVSFKIPEPQITNQIHDNLLAAHANPNLETVDNNSIDQSETGINDNSNINNDQIHASVKIVEGGNEEIHEMKLKPETSAAHSESTNNDLKPANLEATIKKEHEQANLKSLDEPKTHHVKEHEIKEDTTDKVIESTLKSSVQRRKMRRA